MCGIAGVTFKKKVDQETKERFKALVRTLQHPRGPDDFNEMQVGPDTFFFHNRLSIIDVERASQPMSNDSGTLVFNGEIYNFRALRDPAISYRYDSDTEVLLYGYQKEGETFLHKTNSMFGFGYYDRKGRTITLGRDRIGIKQVYYIETDEVFAFASTLRPLVMFSQKKINTKHLWKYYLNRAFAAPHTLFEDICELEPGALVIYDTRTHKISFKRKWWKRAPLCPIYDEETETLFELDDLLHKSIKDRLVADVNVGAYVSGGVDSGIIAAIASQYHPDLEIFTVKMDDARYDESAYAKAIARRYLLRYHEIVLSGNEFLDHLHKWIEMQDDIVANPSSLPLYLLADLARQNGYKVMLAGEGADELFGGYGTYKRFMLAKNIYRYFFFLKPFASTVGKMFSDSRKRFFVQNALSDPLFFGTAQLFEPYLLKEMLENAPSEHGVNTLAKALDLDLKDRVPNDLLTSNADRASMAASIEARVPFLAHQIVDFAAKIDPKLLIRNGRPKYILKRLAENYIPKENIYRKKVGFEMPLNAWLRNELRDVFEEVLANSVQKDIVDLRIVRRLYEDHLSGKIDASGKLFAFLALELSHRSLVTS